jgi:uncharacterized RmlC-like cupin family protein
MANVTITEFAGISGNKAQVASGLITNQVVTIGAEADSSVFNSATTFIRVYAGAACHITWGPSPTATTSMLPMAATQTEYFGVTGGTDKLSVIAAT